MEGEGIMGETSKGKKENSHLKILPEGWAEREKGRGLLLTSQRQICVIPSFFQLPLSPTPESTENVVVVTWVGSDLHFCLQRLIDLKIAHTLLFHPSILTVQSTALFFSLFLSRRSKHDPCLALRACLICGDSWFKLSAYHGDLNEADGSWKLPC